MKREKMYEAPAVEIVLVEAEGGFSVSGGTLDNFGYGGDLSGGNE